MRRQFTIEAAVAFGVAALGGTTALAGTGELDLSHGPPLLGGELVLELEGADPGEPLLLYAARGRDETVTPHGVLELDQATLTTVAVGAADAEGRWSYARPIPSDAQLAERELHLQALVGDPMVPGDAELTPALHLRLVGPRAYAAWRGGPDANGMPVDGGLVCASLVDGAELWRIDLGPPDPPLLVEPQGEGRVVLDDDHALAGVLRDDGAFVVLEPFFGEVVATTQFHEPSPVPGVDPVSGLWLVLETGYRAGQPPGDGYLFWVPRAQAGTISSRRLGGTAPGLWAIEAERSIACIAELEPATSRTRVRFVDLTTRRVRGAVDVGAPGHRAFSDLVLADGQLFVTTYDEGPFPYDARLTRIDLATLATTQLAFTEDLTLLEPCVDRDELWLGGRSAFGFGGGLQVTSLSSPAPLVEVPGSPPTPLFVPSVVRARGAEAWILDRAGTEPPNGDDPARLFRFDPAAGAWTMHPTVWYEPEGPPAHLDVLDDALAAGVVLAREGFVVPGPGSVDPALEWIDTAGGADWSLPIGPDPVLAQTAGVDAD